MALENRERIDALLTQANTLSRDIHEQRIQEMANVNGGGGSGPQIIATTTTASNLDGLTEALLGIAQGYDDNLILCSILGNDFTVQIGSKNIPAITTPAWCRAVSPFSIAFPVGVIIGEQYRSGILVLDSRTLYLYYNDEYVEVVDGITGTVQVDTITIKRPSLNP